MVLRYLIDPPVNTIMLLNFDTKLKKAIHGWSFFVEPKIDRNENFEWYVSVNYRISILNNTVQKTISLNSHEPILFSLDKKVGWPTFLEWGTLLNTKLG